MELTGGPEVVKRKYRNTELKRLEVKREMFETEIFQGGAVKEKKKIFSGDMLRNYDARFRGHRCRQ